MCNWAVRIQDGCGLCDCGDFGVPRESMQGCLCVERCHFLHRFFKLHHSWDDYFCIGEEGGRVLKFRVLLAGFLFDREWMVVKAENGRCITMSRSPKLALVQPSLPAAALRGESVPSNAFLGMYTLNLLNAIKIAAKFML